MRVAAYCRVSTNRYEQQESLQSQIAHYTEYINSNPDWANAGIYIDSGRSAKRRQKRADYMRLMNDCRAGKIDKIICKGVRRFSRNLVDCLEDVRELTSLGISIFFENENLDTSVMNGELILSTVVSVSENELTNIAQNVKWANQRKYSEGKCVLNSVRFLGYDLIDGQLIINEKEAEIVRLIFKKYNEGKGTQKIARELNTAGYLTVTRKAYQDSTILAILKNEKYYGRLILQKYIKNKNGSSVLNDAVNIPIYDWGIAHEPIVSEDEFMKAQQRLSWQKEKYKVKRNNLKYSNPFYEIIICGECRKPYVKVIHNSESKYPTEHFSCTTYVKKGKSCCDNKSIKRKTLEQIFVKLHNEFVDNEFGSAVRTADAVEINRITERIKELLNKEKQFLIFIARGIEKSVYQKDYEKLKAELEELYRQKIEAEKNYAEEIQRENKLKAIEKYFAAAKHIDCFNESIFRLLVKEIIVEDREHLVFIFTNGQRKPITYKYQRYKDIV